MVDLSSKGKSMSAEQSELLGNFKMVLRIIIIITTITYIIFIVS